MKLTQASTTSTLLIAAMTLLIALAVLNAYDMTAHTAPSTMTYEVIPAMSEQEVLEYLYAPATSPEAQATKDVVIEQRRPALEAEQWDRVVKEITEDWK